jgi:membrane protein
MSLKPKKTPSSSALATAGATWALSALLQRITLPASLLPQAHPLDAGAQADSPTEIPPKGWWQVLKRTFANFSDNRLLAVAAGVTFYSLLALFPGVAAFISLYGLVADASSINNHVASLSGLLPGGALDILSDQVRRITSKPAGTLGFSFALGLGTALWSANAGVKALFDALNVVYGEQESRSFIRLNLVSLLFTLGAILLGFTAIAAITLVPLVLQTVGLGAVTQWILWAARWPVLLGVIILGLALLYRFGPSRNNAKWRWITPGSALAAIVWLIFSMLFSWYVANFGSYNETYGTLGTVVGFMTWIWLSTVIVLLGGAMNAELEEQTAKDTSKSA